MANWDAVPLAAAGWLLLLILGAASLAPVRRRMRYEHWYAIHLTAYAAIVLAFFHQTRLGRDFTRNQVLTAYWFGLHAFVAVNLIFFRLLSPAFLFWRHRFTPGTPVLIDGPHGAKALELLSGGCRPGLILLDIIMPVMDGLRFLELKNADPLLAPIPVVMMSATERRAHSGVAHLVAKPMDLDDLERVIEQHYESP